jgi:replicative DNA helicase
VLEGVDEWYRTHENPPTLDDVINVTFARGVPEKLQDYLKGVFSSLRNVDGQHSIRLLLDKFRNQRILEDLATAAYEASKGSSVQNVISLADQIRNPKSDLAVEYVTDDLTDILDDTVKKRGLRWRLNSLNRSLGSLRQGDFGFIFARPETGKTTFLASEVTHMASQLSAHSGPILWFNNEEGGKKVKLRCFQAALGARLDHLLRAPDRAKVGYQEKTHGKLKIFDSASLHKAQVESICAREKPSLIVFDQIDKVHGFDDDREDLKLGAIYQWARELAKLYCPVLGICQADATAEGEMWLHMNHVANAKTAKQAEADFILGIGKVHDPGKDQLRYLNISKNKLIGDDDTEAGLRHGRMEVLIHPQIARYSDLGEEIEG